MDPDSQHELELRGHIRYLLLDYAKTHLTTNYLNFSEDAVSELLSECLCIVPTTDPHSLTLPEDSFQALSRTLGLPDLKPWDEIWPADRNGIQLLRKSLTFSGKPRVERCWDDEDEFNYNSWIYRPMSPILTTRAIRDTPKLGSSVALKSIPKSQDDVLKSFKRVDSEVIEEPPRAKLEDALNLRLAIDSKSHSSMVSLFALSFPQMFPPHVNLHINSFLYSDSALPALSQPEFVPTFARVGRLGGAQELHTVKFDHPSISNALWGLLLMLPELAVVEDEDNDLYKQHMVIIDGWQTLAPSSPSSIGTPSLASGTSEIDELFLMSPAGSQPIPIQELMASRIDATEIPRSKKIGGTAQKAKLIGEGQSLGLFLSPFVSSTSIMSGETSNPRIVTTPRSSPRSSISLSILGQPPSLPDTRRPSEFSYKDAGTEDQQMDLDAVVSQLYAEVRECDPVNLILKERLDEKGGMLMDVPNMPQPTVHPPTSMNLPTTMHELLYSSITSKLGDNCHGFWRKVAGLKSLNMELSWKPFQKVPTDEEVARVEGGIQGTQFAQFADTENEELEALLEISAVSSDSVDSNIFRDWDCIERNIKPVDLVHSERFEAMLTREERQRLIRLSVDLENDRIESPAALHSLGDVGRTSHNKERLPSFYRADHVRLGKSSHTELEPQEAIFDESTKSTGWYRDRSQLDDSGVSFVHLPGSIGNETFDKDQFICDADLPQKADEENLPLAPDYPLSQRTFDGLDEDNDPDSFLFEVRDEDMGNGIFIPLSFESYHGHSNHPPHRHNSGQEIIPDTYLDEFPAYETNLLCDSLTPEVPTGHTTEVIDVGRRSNPACRYSESTSDTLTNATFDARSLADFLAWRNISVNQVSLNPPGTPRTATVAPDNTSPPEAHVTPESVFDRNTLFLPSPWLLPSTPHRYLTSLDLLQKRSIVRALGLPECAVELVERDTIGGVDLILDPHTAVIFASLMSLPTQCETLTASLSHQSWRYSRLLVIFEAFPSSLAYHSDPASTRLAPNPYTPPILKAIKKFRRDLGIAEALDNKYVSSMISFAFAGSVQEAALFTRYFGNYAEASDTTSGAVWGPRKWLDVDEQEGERDLANMDGMNAFAASIILYQETLQDFLDLAAEARVLEFGHLVGTERVTIFNEVLDRRYQLAMASSPPYTQASDDATMIQDG
ncbi:hypothetical protein PILCRDRAFT_825707 [Piloderma croceum F 1598]|uniref:Uncharacterized protein n=1 Tax=Piloderma croceum (strain F 1598) TaxID=765440 RepID=A0A0C3FBD5_PILCF|nr:hypothetical protein PILCRDRAFT_825707 [Piloderma croceum F 1598]